MDESISRSRKAPGPKWSKFHLKETPGPKWGEGETPCTTEDMGVKSPVSFAAELCHFNS